MIEPSAKDVTHEAPWYLLTSRPRMETRVTAHLQRLGLSWLAPTVMAERWVGGRRVARQEWLFPRYVFVQADFTQTPFSHLQYLQGVSGFVRQAGQLLTVPQQVIASLRRRSADAETEAWTPRFIRGQTVRLDGQGFNGMEAIFLEPDGQRRSVLLIKMLGRELETRVDNRYLAAV